MKPKKQIQKGDRFGNLIILREVARKSYNKRRFLCLCDCGKEKEVNLIHLTTGNTKSCGCFIPNLNKQRVGEKSKTWKGGRYKDGDYILVYKPGHPNSKKTGYVREHRLIMSEYLNRPLLKSEDVHHINGIKTDNRLENLELWSSSHPRGQRIVDQIEWAKEILEIYKNYESKFK